MSATVYSHCLLQLGSQFSPRRLPFEPNWYSIDGHDEMNRIQSQKIYQEDDESAIMDPSSPASSSCSDGDTILRGAASQKAFMRNSQKRSLSAFSPHSRMSKMRISSPIVSASNVESSNSTPPPSHPSRAQSWPRMPPSCKQYDVSLQTQVVEESQFDAYSDDGIGGSEAERRLSKLKRFGRRMSNVFRHLCKA